jgi:hypothetical protein
MRIRSLVIVLGLLVAPAAQAAYKLLAPVYPGAMHDQLADDDHYQFFFTHDSIDKVRAYYAGQNVALVDGARQSDFATHGLCMRKVALGTVNQCYAKVLMAQGLVARYLKDMTLAYDAGLVVQAKAVEQVAAEAPPQSTGNADLDKLQAQLAAAQAQLQAQADAEAVDVGFKRGELDVMNHMSDLFDGLKGGIMQPSSHSSTELIGIYQRYRYLETAEYPYAKSADGELVSYDRWLLAKDKAAFASPGDHWDDWIGFLKDLDAHAYRTRIIIPVDPRSWGGKR